MIYISKLLRLYYGKENKSWWMSVIERCLRTAELRERQAKANITYSVQRKPAGQPLCTYWLIKKYVGSSRPAIPNVIYILVGVLKAAKVNALGIVQKTEICKKLGFLHMVRSRV